MSLWQNKLGSLAYTAEEARFCKKLSRPSLKKAGLEIKANSLGPQ
jgi:hypothetical protein